MNAAPLPGAHVAIFSDSPTGSIEGRLRGLELRDTILVLRPGPKSGFVFLFRQPIAESTVAGQVIATGTGAINIDGCRIATGGEQLSISRADPFHNADGTQKWNPTSTGAIEREQHPGGRWPPNVVLVHGPNCTRIGSRHVKTGVAVRRHVGKSGGHYGFGAANPDMREDVTYGEDGLEAVPAFACEPGCPVPILDALSEEMGIHGAGGAIHGRPAGLGYDATSYHLGRERTFHRFGDAGGATRFYPQFASESELVAWVERLITPP